MRYFIGFVIGMVLIYNQIITEKDVEYWGDWIIEQYQEWRDFREKEVDSSIE